MRKEAINNDNISILKTSQYPAILQDSIVIGNSNQALEFAYKTCSFLICTTPNHFTNTEILYKQFLRGLVFQYSLEILNANIVEDTIFLRTQSFDLAYSFNKLYILEKINLFDSINFFYEKENNIIFDVLDHFKANQFLKSNLDEKHFISNDEGIQSIEISKRDIFVKSKISFSKINDYDMSYRQVHLLTSSFLRNKQYNLYRHNDVIKKLEKRIIEWEDKKHSYAINNNKIIFINLKNG